MYGVVLTNTDTLQNYIARLKRHNFTCAKIITDWGLGRAWRYGDIQTLVNNINYVIGRTALNGDPSYYKSRWYLEPNDTLKEIELLVSAGVKLIELGNEPDVVWDNDTDPSEDDIWVYRYFLIKTIKKIKENYPNVRIIAPSPRIGKYHNWYRWIEIMHEPLAQCHYLSAHLYGYHNLFLDNRDKADFYHIKPIYDRLFPGKQVIVTECGIHDATQSAAEKIAKYNQFYLELPEHWKGMCIYHYNKARDINPEYAVFP